MNSESVSEERVDILQTQFNIICCKYTHYFRYNKGKVLKMQILNTKSHYLRAHRQQVLPYILNFHIWSNLQHSFLKPVIKIIQ